MPGQISPLALFEREKRRGINLDNVHSRHPPLQGPLWSTGGATRKWSAQFIEANPKPESLGTNDQITELV
jgi:hypothetical protein